ncbi:hypothetical protein ACQ4PT_047682 [Festuca glaucescens]
MLNFWQLHGQEPVPCEPLPAHVGHPHGRPYHVNLYRLMSAIPMAADSNGFFNGTFGVAGDEVFGLFMCYASDTDPECQDCLDRAPGGIMKLCPRSRTVRAVYESCTLQYSNESFSVADLSIADSVDLSFPPQPEQTAYQSRYDREAYENWYSSCTCRVRRGHGWIESDEVRADSSAHSEGRPSGHADCGGHTTVHRRVVGAGSSPPGAVGLGGVRPRGYPRGSRCVAGRQVRRAGDGAYHDGRALVWAPRRPSGRPAKMPVPAYMRPPLADDSFGSPGTTGGHQQRGCQHDPFNSKQS